MAKCTYCGAHADHRDHVVPHAFAGDGRKRYGRDVCVPACAECNMLLGSKLFITVGERASYISEALTKRYRKALDTPDWTFSELKALKRTLRQSVERYLDIKADVSVRIARADFIAAYGPTIKEVWEWIDAAEGAADGEPLGEE